jgi:putative cardiolipin synthase
MFHYAPPRHTWPSLLFSASLSLIFLAPSGRADVLRILSDNQQAAQARVDLIQGARFEINAAYFAVNEDHLALAFLALLRDASRRGVEVRLLVDGLRNDIPGSVQAYLISEGVEIREFHQVNVCRPFEINRRMHDKVLIVDACEMIVGGRNLGQCYFGLAKRNYVDRDAYLRGKTAAQANAYFQCVWSSEEVRPTKINHWQRPDVRNIGPTRCTGQPGNTAWIPPRVALDEAMFGLCASGFVRPDMRGDWAAGQPELEGVCFLSDYCGRKGSPGAITDVMLDLVAYAQNSIILESPYLVISPDLEAALALAQARGVCVVILTNSLASTDQILAFGGYANQKQKLLARGIQLWEFAGPDHLHAKSLLIDGQFSVIGSYNFDPRAERLDTETAIVAWDPIVAADLSESMAEHFANAWRIGSDGKPVHAYSRHPGADKSTICKLHGARLVALLIKQQL